MQQIIQLPIPFLPPRHDAIHPFFMSAQIDPFPQQSLEPPICNQCMMYRKLTFRDGIKCRALCFVQLRQTKEEEAHCGKAVRQMGTFRFGSAGC